MNSSTWLRLCLAAFVALGVVYSIATPIFEASDEVSHYAVIQQIVDTGNLPVQRPGVKTAWEQEGSQPPLYYLLTSVVVRAVGASDFAERDYRNPHALPGDPSLDANRNLVIHSPAEDFPWRGTTLAVHLLRLVSIALGLITIAMGYQIARRLFPDSSSIPIGTAALIAFNPMFIFISASVNNDNLVVALSSIALYLTVVCWQETRLDRAAWFRRALLGGVLGAAALTKISGLTLLPVIGLMLTARHLDLGGFRRQAGSDNSHIKTSEVLVGREWRAWLITGGLLLVLVAAIAGWWYLRNVQLYGEPLGLDTMVAIAGPRTTPQTIGQLIAEFDGFRYSYWGLFGAVNILTFSLAYTVFDAFTLITLIGLGTWLVINRRRKQTAPLLLLLSYALLVCLGVIRWTLMTPASQGRLMFTAITVISLGLWLGWETVFNFRFSMRNDQLTLNNWRQLRWAMPVFMLVIAGVAPFRDIAPTYAGPIMLAPDQVPATIEIVNADYGEDLRLLGYVKPARDASDGFAEFTLYWQCLRQPQSDLSVFAIVYGRDLSEIGKRDAYPYHGLFATRQCLAGQVFADPYRMRLKAEALRPTLLRVQIGLKDWARDIELKPSMNGQPLASVIFVAGKLTPDRLAATPTVAAPYRLGDAIELMGYDRPQFDREHGVIRYRLYWHVADNAAAIPDDYTVFAHALDDQGAQIGQGDSQPFNGDYPTSMWSAGESFVEERALALTAGVAPDNVILALGLYRLSDGARLPVVDVATGQHARDDQIVLSVK